MGLFDDVTVLLSKGMDAADKKAQEMRYQSEISQINDRKKELLAELGRDILLEKADNLRFLSSRVSTVKAIEDLERQEATLRMNMEELQRSNAAVSLGASQSLGVLSIACPSCGSLVSSDSAFCPSCGKGMRANYTQQCPSCGALYGGGAVFCEKCGTHVIELNTRLDDERSSLNVDESVKQADLTDAEEGGEGIVCSDESTIKASVESLPRERKCAVCGELLLEDAVFCGSCGAKV